MVTGFWRVDIGAFEYGRPGYRPAVTPRPIRTATVSAIRRILCAGFDDAVDTDSDGAPDGCDLCPGFDDGPDADADGVPDDCDQCQGSDDGEDVDEDGQPDGCDDLVDSDGDGIADARDTCPGHDDAVDSDGDSVPDGCDRWPGVDDLVFSDEDDDGMPQDWEEKYGLDLQRNDSDEDPDGDLFTNHQEYLAGTHPKDPGSRPENHAPATPALNFPPDNGETVTLSPTLSVSNANDDDGHQVKYTFELYADEGLTTLVAVATDIAGR